MIRKNRAGRIGWSTLLVALLGFGLFGGANPSAAADRVVFGELYTAEW